MYIAISNSIGSSSRVNAGGGGGGFTNTYSLAFDGVDDFVSAGDMSQLSSASAITVSLWFNPAGNSNKLLLDFKEGSSRITVQRLSNSQIYLYVNTVYAVYNITTSTSNWYNLGYVFDGSGASDADRLKLYINGSEISASSFSGTVPSSIGAFTSAMDSKIGSLNNGSFSWLGSIDEVAIWNNVQDVASIYSATGAVDLTSLNPTAWYRMGDNGSYKSPQWLIPNNSNVANSRISNYSFDFDGVDNIISMGDVLDFDYNEPFTISAWINLEAFSYSFAGVVSKQEASGNFRGYFLHIDETSGVYNLKFILGNTLSNRIRIQGTTDLLGLGWTHIACTYDGSTNASGTKLYINGSLETLNAGLTQDTLGSNTTLNSASFNIGSRGGSRFFEGNIDEVSVFNSELSSTDINSLYGGGTPSAITGSVAHYKMGEEANFTDNWLVNNSALSNYSTRSFNFDGVDDQIDLPDIPFVRAGGQHFSISTWVNTNSSAQGAYFGTRVAPSSTNTIYFWRNPAGSVVLQINNSSTGNIEARSSVTLSNNQWYHIAATFDGSEPLATDRIKIYINGILSVGYQSGTGTNLPSGSTGIFNFIGRLNVGLYQSGNIDEVAIWDSTLTSGNVTTIYNSGTPADISSLSPVSWWRMGEDATFSTNWSLPDNGSASNTGTSANMTIADLEGEAPNYTGGGLSANMTIEDRVGDAPNSTSNALSYNMTESDRKEDTPPTP